MAKKSEFRPFKGRGPVALDNARKYQAATRSRKRKWEQPRVPRTVRLPAASWERLEAEAEQLGVPAHKLLRRIIADWLYRMPTVVVLK